MKRHLQKLMRRAAICEGCSAKLRRWKLQFLGAAIGKGTVVPAGVQVTWPHQIQLGESCILQTGVFFNFDHFWCPGPSIIVGDRVFIGRDSEFNIRVRLSVGSDTLIASGVKIIDHDHGLSKHSLIRSQIGPESEVRLGNDVWIGVNAVILKGVAIGDGAVVGAGAIVTRSIPPGEIWAGNPAVKIGVRS